MKGTNFHHRNVFGVSIPPQSVTNTSVNGNAITEPWRLGNQLSLLAMGGAFASSAAGAIAIQGQRRDDDSWEPLKEWDGTTDLAFTASKLADGADIENGAILGTVDLKRADGETYKALRVVFTESGNAAALIAVGHVINDLHRVASGQTDDLFSKQRRA